MNNKDIIQRFIFENANVRGEIVRLNESFQTIVKQHTYPDAIRKLLGEMLVTSGLLTAIIKTQGRLTVQFQGKEPLKLMLAQCSNDFKLRGLAQWQGDLSEEELLIALKKGTLAIIIDPETTTSRYQGLVSWQGDSLTESIEGYFRDSEQLPTRLWLAINDTDAVGFLLQTLPAEGAKKTQPVIADNDWEHIVCLTETITSEELLTLDNYTLLHRLYSQEEVRVFEPTPVVFGCTCSMQRGEHAIVMLGQAEAEEELKDKQLIVVTCEFCNSEYKFDHVDVARIFKENNNGSSAPYLH